MGQTATKKKKNWVQHAKLAFRKRWVQVGIIVLIWILAGLMTVSVLGPKPVKDKSKYKFLHCDVCGTEMPYNPDLDSKKCPKCPPPNTGWYRPTVESIKTGYQLDPWNKVYVALFVEVLVMLTAVVYLLYLPVANPANTYFILACPYCSQRLRYRGVSHGGMGSCSKCKRMFRFPDEEEAVTEEEVMKAEAAALRGGE